MSRVSGDDDGLATSSGYGSGETAAGCGLADPSLSAYENPVQSGLVDDVLQCTWELLLHQFNNTLMCTHIQTYSTITDCV